MWILDDDDECIEPAFIERLKTFTQDDPPAVVIVRMDHGPLGVLPAEATWGQRPHVGGIGVSGFVVRADVWEATHDLWQERYDADGLYIGSLWDMGYRFGWLDVVASRCQRFMSSGRGEDE